MFRNKTSHSPEHQQPDINKMLSTGAKRADKKVQYTNIKMNKKIDI